MEDILQNTAGNALETIAEELGLKIGIGDGTKCLASYICTETLKNGLGLILPGIASGISFSATGITLAIMRHEIRKINNKIKSLLEVSQKVAIDQLDEAMVSFETGNYSDAYEGFKSVGNKATEGFNLATNNSGILTCCKLKLFSIYMTKSYDKKMGAFVPFLQLESNRRMELASLLKQTLDKFFKEFKEFRPTFVDTVLLKNKIKKQIQQSNVNDLLIPIYPILSHGLSWTNPSKFINPKADVVKILVEPKYLPIQAGDDSIKVDLTVGVNQSINLYRIKDPESKEVKLVINENSKFTCVIYNHSIEDEEDFSTLDQMEISLEFYINKILAFNDLNSLLISACRIGKIDLIRETINVGISRGTLDLNHQNFNGETAIGCAIQYKNTEVLQYLVSQKMTDLDLNKPCWKNGDTPLSLAVRLNDIDVINIIIGSKDIDVDINSLNLDGSTSFFLACQLENLSLCKLLYKSRGANINLRRSSDGSSPLYISCQKGHYEIVKYLLSIKNIDIESKRLTDITSPMWIAASKGHLQIVKLLAEKVKKRKDYLNNPSNEGITPIEAAEQNGHSKVVQYLQKNIRRKSSKFLCISPITAD